MKRVRTTSQHSALGEENRANHFQAGASLASGVGSPARHRLQILRYFLLRGTVQEPGTKLRGLVG